LLPQRNINFEQDDVKITVIQPQGPSDIFFLYWLFNHNIETAKNKKQYIKIQINEAIPGLSFSLSRSMTFGTYIKILCIWALIFPCGSSFQIAFHARIVSARLFGAQ